MNISLTDNTLGKQSGMSFDRKEASALFALSGKTVSELCRDNRNLLVFPYSVESTDDKIGESTILTVVNTDNPELVLIDTGNIMGFIGIGDVQLKISSRFDDGGKDYLLHYMLQKVMSFNLFDLSHNNERDDVFDFLMFMFPYFLKSALRQGVYREYKRYEHNDSRVRGAVDVSRFIRTDVPFAGKIAYNTREHTQDNDLTQLIRHTIEFMRTKRYGQAVLGIDQDTKENVKLISSITPTYNRNERSSIIQKNLRPKVHPYYTDYEPMQSLCIQILRMEQVKYGENEEEICGILFDGAWLWEEYVNTLLDGLGFTHPKNKLGTDAIYLFQDDSGSMHRSGPRFPDFYIQDKIVLDAKYKRIGSYDKVAEVNRDDIHQIMAYMETVKASIGGFVAPLREKRPVIPTAHLLNSQASISIYGIKISKEDGSYEEFCKSMVGNEREFIEAVSSNTVISDSQLCKANIK